MRPTSRTPEYDLRRSSYKDTDAKVARFNRTHLAADQRRADADAADRQPALGRAGGRRLLLRLALQHRPLLDRRSGGLPVAAASILDGCDGEIARLKYQESALGCWIETFGDYSYYIAIFIGLTVGAVRQTGYELFYWVGGAALAGSLLTFAPADLPARADHQRSAEPAARRRQGPLQVGAHGPVEGALEDLVRRHARGDALRHHGVRADQCPAGDPDPRRHRHRTSTGSAW